MASIYEEIVINADPADVWSAARDFGAVHERLVPGLVVESRLEGNDVRVVTFHNGATAREVLVGIDEHVRRLAYSVVEGALGSTHHNASVQVFPVDAGTRFVWVTDVLPDQLAVPVGRLMRQGLQVIKRTCESP